MRRISRDRVWRWESLATVGLVLVVVLAACGGSGTDASPEDGNGRVETTAEAAADAPTTTGNGSNITGSETTPPGEATGELTHVRIALPGRGVPFYGWYAAQYLGYWEDEGLDIELLETGGSGESSQLLAAGQVDVAEATADTLLQAVSAGVNVYPFYNFWERENRRFVVPVDSQIESVADLEGLTVGITERAGAEVPLVNALLAAEGILDSVELVAVSNAPATVLAAFEQDRIQAYAGETQTLISLDAQGVETRSILPEELETGPLVPTAASEEFADQTDVLVGIARGVAKGSLFCLTSVEACVDLIAEHRPEFVEDRELALETVVDGYFPITAPEQVDGKYVFGTTNSLDQWNTLVETYSSGPDPLYEDPSTYPLEELVIDDLIDEINDFDYDAVVQEAESAG